MDLRQACSPHVQLIKRPFWCLFCCHCLLVGACGWSGVTLTGNGPHTMVKLKLGCARFLLNYEKLYKIWYKHLPFFFQCPIDYNNPKSNDDNVSRYVFFDLYGWVWILAFLSQCWIVAHIWKPKSRKLAKTEQMFGTPYYNGLLTDQSMMLNRRSDKGQLNFRLDFQMRRRSSSTRK